MGNSIRRIDNYVMALFLRFSLPELKRMPRKEVVDTFVAWQRRAGPDLPRPWKCWQTYAGLAMILVCGAITGVMALMPDRRWTTTTAFSVVVPAVWFLFMCAARVMFMPCRPSMAAFLEEFVPEGVSDGPPTPST